MKTCGKRPVYQHKESQNQPKKGRHSRMRKAPTPPPDSYFQRIPDPAHARQTKAVGFLQTKELP